MTSLADGVVAEEELADVDPDLALLRTYEPVLRYTAGELFLPTSVEAYLAKCSLWADDGGSRRKRRVEELVPAGELTPDGLAAAGVRHRNRPLYLRFVQQAAQPGRGRGVAPGGPTPAAGQGAVRGRSVCSRG